MADDGGFGPIEIASFMAHLEVNSLDNKCPYCLAEPGSICKSKSGSSHIARLAGGEIPPTLLK